MSGPGHLAKGALLSLAPRQRGLGLGFDHLCDERERIDVQSIDLSTIQRIASQQELAVVLDADHVAAGYARSGVAINLMNLNSIVIERCAQLQDGLPRA